MKTRILTLYHQRLNGWNATRVYQGLDMMVVRVNLRIVLCALCCGVLLVTLYWSQCQLTTRPGTIISSSLSERKSPAAASSHQDIECFINGEYAVACKRQNDEVYVPFSFIHKYFEIYGKITSRDGVDKFEWSHSYSKVYHPKRRYDPTGTYTTFENYNVEVRERVKCISGIDGVPVSTQWEPKGFYYPTQIAQYGLAHYSKNITEPEPRVRVLDDGEKRLEKWIVSQDATFTRVYDKELRTNVIKFSTSDQMTSQVWLKLDISLDLVLSVDVMLKRNSSLTVVLQNKDKKETVYLHYVTNMQLISAQDEHIYYGIGREAGWRRLTRDLVVDMQKGWALQGKPKRKSPRNKFKISSMIVCGEGWLDNVTVSTHAHSAMFVQAARWLVRAQVPRSGGWPVPVRRRIAQGLADLTPGWHSAMSQGHGVSVLARAFHRTGDPVYLRAAERALRPLDVPSGGGGVRAMWMDHYVWYEEYPTTPPLFVLNGFIYTLLGLYDLHHVQGENSVSLAGKMYQDGMRSLKHLLPLFDTGSGSFYDLRHFTLGVAPNIARWDYHATHVNQLYLLAGLDDDPIIINTARRWEGYMRGRRAHHN